MKEMLTSDEYYNMLGSKEFRHQCKLVGCFNLLRFWLSVAEYKNLRSGEAGFSHTSRRIYREFIHPQDMLEFVSSEERKDLGEILETEKRAPPADMFDSVWDVAGHELYEVAFLKFTKSEQGKRWWKDFQLMKKHAGKVLKCQACLRRIVVKKLIKICTWLEMTLRLYFNQKNSLDEKKFGQWLADRKRLKGLADELGSTLTEYDAEPSGGRAQTYPILGGERSNVHTGRRAQNSPYWEASAVWPILGGERKFSCILRYLGERKIAQTGRRAQNGPTWRLGTHTHARTLSGTWKSSTR